MSAPSTSLLTGRMSTSRSGTSRRYPQGGYLSKYFVLENLFQSAISWYMNFKVSRPITGFPLDPGCHREEGSGLQSLYDYFCYFSGWSACSEHYFSRCSAVQWIQWIKHVSVSFHKLVGPVCSWVGEVQTRSKRTKVLKYFQGFLAIKNICLLEFSRPDLRQYVTLQEEICPGYKLVQLLFLRANLWSFAHIKPRICCQQLNTTAQQAAGLNKGWGQQDLKLQFSKSLGMCRLLGSPKLWTSFERGEIWEHYTAPCTQLTKMSGVEVSFSAPTYVPWA